MSPYSMSTNRLGKRSSFLLTFFFLCICRGRSLQCSASSACRRRGLRMIMHGHWTFLILVSISHERNPCRVNKIIYDITEWRNTVQAAGEPYRCIRLLVNLFSGALHASPFGPFFPSNYWSFRPAGFWNDLGEISGIGMHGVAIGLLPSCSLFLYIQVLFLWGSSVLLSLVSFHPSQQTCSLLKDIAFRPDYSHTWPLSRRQYATDQNRLQCHHAGHVSGWLRLRLSISEWPQGGHCSYTKIFRQVGVKRMHFE